MILEVKNLSYQYHNSRTIFHDVNLHLDKGQVISILGRNGAGKSTLLNCLANLYTPASGEIFLDGKSMRRLPLNQVSRFIGYVPQAHYPVYAYSVRNFVVMGRTPYIRAFSTPSKSDYEKVDQVLDKLGIAHLADKAYTEIMTTHSPDHVLMVGGLVGVLNPDGVLEFGEAGKILTEERLSELYQVNLRLFHVDEFNRDTCVAALS